MEKTNTRDELNKELEELSPKLSSMLLKKKQDDLPFRYFENLSDRVIDQLNTQTKTKSNWIDELLFMWNTKKVFVFAMAAMIGIILFAGLFMKKFPTQDLDFVKLDHDEIKTYLISHATDLEDEQLSLLQSNITKVDLLNLTDEDLKPVLDEYLDQINMEDLN